MKIRATFARTTIAAAALAALAVPTAAQAEFDQPDLPITTGQVDADAMRDDVVSQLQGRVFGWQLAIAQDGQLELTDKRGTAKSQFDNGGGASLGMQPNQKMELASVTKNITAVATMKLLRRNGLTVESYVAPQLPAAWEIGPGFNKVKFRHLLTHTSGINQAIQAMPADERPTDNSWAAMRKIVKNGTVAGSQRQYKNANFAILRVVNARLWNKTDGKVSVPVTATNHTAYTLDFMRKHIFQPAGLTGIGCIAPGTTTGVHSYPLGAVQSTDGKVLGTGSDECAGARGIAMSSIQLVQYLAHLRHGDIIEPADLATMDALRAGWNEDSNLGDGGQSGPADGVADNFRSEGVFWHGGDLLGTNQLHTCAMTFDDGTEATLLVNSPIAADNDSNTSDTQCGVLLRAWFDNKVS